MVCLDEFDDFVIYEVNEVMDSVYMGFESIYSECEIFMDEDISILVYFEL